MLQARYGLDAAHTIPAEAGMDKYYQGGDGRGR